VQLRGVPAIRRHADELTAAERTYAVDAIMRWIGREIPDAPQ